MYRYPWLVVPAAALGIFVAVAVHGFTRIVLSNDRAAKSKEIVKALEGEWVIAEVHYVNPLDATRKVMVLRYPGIVVHLSAI